MPIHLSRDGTALGSFSEAEVREKLSRGELTGTEMASGDGVGDWLPLHILVSNSDSPIVPETTTSGLAIASLICGFAGLVVWIPALPAVIMGHIALSQIKRSEGALRGGGLAIGGLLTGYLILAIYPIAMLFMPVYGGVTVRANQDKRNEQLQTNHRRRACFRWRE